MIFFSGDEWGLPLAIAANLQIRYRIEIGAQHLRDVQIVDEVGRGNFIFHFIFIFSLNVEQLNARLVYLYQNNFSQGIL